LRPRIRIASYSLTETFADTVQMSIKRLQVPGVEFRHSDRDGLSEILVGVYFLVLQVNFHTVIHGIVEQEELIVALANNRTLIACVATTHYKTFL
jgi:hypothetical protein